MYYVAHRLFAAHDRALGAYVANRLARGVGGGQVFLPFCDTDEENLADPCKGRRLFELDCQRLRSLDGMIAILHGPSLDDGVCMEIGYATALGAPVIALTTDFQTYGPAPDGPARAFPDPLLDTLVTEVVRVPVLAAPPGSASDRFSAFLRRNVGSLRVAADLAVSAMLRARPRSCEPSGRAAGHPGQPMAFLEPSPYVADSTLSQAARMLRAQGWLVHAANRLGDLDDPLSSAATDWAAVQSADLAVIDTSGPEAPPGAALVAGACAARGTRVLAANWRASWTFAHGREPNWRNLMIQYAVSGHFATLSDLAAMIAVPT